MYLYTSAFILNGMKLILVFSEVIYFETADKEWNNSVVYGRNVFLADQFI
jgi:hypothetical protein